MADFAQNNDGDFLVINGDIVLATPEQEIRNRNLNRLKFFRGEYFLDRNDGLPYFEFFFQKGVKPSEVATYLLRDLIELNQGFDIEGFDFQVLRRRFILSYTVVGNTLSVPINFSSEDIGI